MIKSKAIFLAAGLLLAGQALSHAEYLSKGFEVMPTFYQGRDSRINGEGVDVGFNLKLAERFTMGGRLEFLKLRGKDFLIGPPQVAVQAHGDALFAGVTAFYRAFEAADRGFGANVGLWAGAVRGSAIGNQGAAVSFSTVMQPFIEPMAQATYGVGPNKAAQIKVGLGYRFIRSFVTAGAPFGLATRPLTNFDGLDIQMGVGYSF